jgi:hypothetical protein
MEEEKKKPSEMSLGEVTKDRDRAVKWARIESDQCDTFRKQLEKVEARGVAVVEALRECFDWDRSEYQSNPDLVKKAEEALKAWDERNALTDDEFAERRKS